jgi:N6-adenosine-specific RNA methylase IME4
MIRLIENGPFKGAGYRRYRVIYADPPWRYLTRSAKGMGRSPDRHYATMTIDEIKALPVRDLAAKDCVLFMWVIDSHVELAMEVVKAWGFKYKTVGFYWMKTNKDDSFFMGTGHWTRANPEHVYEAYLDREQEVERCFLNTVGAPPRRTDGKDVPRLIISPRREHSRKPDVTWERIERLVDGPYIELFGRQQHGEWTVLGNEANKFNDPEIYPDISELV